jgi:hypothetical protein
MATRRAATRDRGLAGRARRAPLTTLKLGSAEGARPLNVDRGLIELARLGQRRGRSSGGRLRLSW